MCLKYFASYHKFYLITFSLTLGLLALWEMVLLCCNQLKPWYLTIRMNQVNFMFLYFSVFMQFITGYSGMYILVFFVLFCTSSFVFYVLFCTSSFVFYGFWFSYCISVCFVLFVYIII